MAEAGAVRTHSDSVTEFACVVLRDSLGSVRKSLGFAAKRGHVDAEHIHQLRISGRRALVAIRLFSDLIPASRATWFRKNLKSILKAAGKARDLDVVIQDQLSKCGPAAGRLGNVWRKQRQESQKSIVGLHRKMRKNDGLRKQTLAILRDLQKPSVAEIALHQQSCEGWAKSQAVNISRQFFAAIPADADNRSLHRLRILTKRFRYTLDFLQPVLENKETSDVVLALAELQKQLGSLQDHVVARTTFQKSLRHLRKRRHQKIVRQLIDHEKDKVTRRVSQFQLRSDSDACQQLKSCIDAVLSLVEVAAAGFK